MQARARANAVVAHACCLNPDLENASRMQAGTREKCQGSVLADMEHGCRTFYIHFNKSPEHVDARSRAPKLSFAEDMPGASIRSCCTRKLAHSSCPPTHYVSD